MRSRKMRPLGSRSHETAWRRQVQREIRAYLRAVNSYADRFAAEPHVSFEQHLGTVSSPVARLTRNLARRHQATS
jgi:hypothetical protein